MILRLIDHKKGDTVSFFADLWIPDPKTEGAENNHHKHHIGIFVRGEILEAKVWGDMENLSNYEYVELTDGRIFRRSTNYQHSSPYGWNECISWGGIEK